MKFGRNSTTEKSGYFATFLPYLYMGMLIMRIRSVRNPTYKGVRAHDSSMAKDSGVGGCFAFTDGDDVFEG